MNSSLPEDLTDRLYGLLLGRSSETLGRLQQAYALIEAHPELANAPLDASHQKALYYAAFHHDLELIRLLLKSGVDVHAGDTAGHTPLFPAIHMSPQATDPEAVRKLATIELLLKAGIDPNQADGSGHTSLHHTHHIRTQPEVLPVLEMLFRYGADPKRATPDGYTPLHLLCGQPDASRLLVAHGADIDARNHNGDTPLIVLSHSLDWTNLQHSIQNLIDLKADLNLRNKSGKAALHYAAYFYTEDLRALLEAGADVSVADRYGYTPLHTAASGCNPDNVRLLIAAGADVNALDKKGRTPLDLTYAGKHMFGEKGACSDGQEREIAALLQAHGAVALVTPPPPALPPENPQGAPSPSSKTRVVKEKAPIVDPVSPPRVQLSEDPLHLQLYQLFLPAPDREARWKQAGELLLEHPEFVRQPLHWGGDTPLHFAVRARHIDLVRQLIFQGADVNALPTNAWSPLSYAVEDPAPKETYQGGIHSLAIVHLLLEAGADPGLGYHILEPCLSITDPERQAHMVELLLKHGVDPNRSIQPFWKDDGDRILHMVPCEASAIIRLLAAYGADPNAQNRRGDTPLLVAVDEGCNEAVRILLEVGADASLANNIKRSPLHLVASEQPDAERMRMLVEAGADVKATDCYGYTPLHFAASACDQEGVKILLIAGADLNARDKKGRTPLDLVIQKRRLSESGLPTDESEFPRMATFLEELKDQPQ